MNNKFKRLSWDKVYEGRIADIIHQRVSIFPGKNIEYEIVHRPSVVLIIPILPSGKILLIWQYRASLNQFIWEFPGGVIKNGETSLDAANRELEEETGYSAQDIQLAKWFYTAPHFSDEKIFVYVASSLISGDSHLQEKEIISAQAFTKSELEAKYQNNELYDAKTLIAYDIIMYSIKDKNEPRS